MHSYNVSMSFQKVATLLFASLLSFAAGPVRDPKAVEIATAMQQAMGGQDACVNLKYIGNKPQGGENCDVVELSFEKVGLTPGDRYRAFVSQKSHLMTHWEYTLQTGAKGSWDWQYGESGGVKLASNHLSPPDNSINMGTVRILKDVDGAYFSDPQKRLSDLK